MRRSYAGAAQAAQLSSPLGGSTADLTIYCNDLSNWPTGTGGYPFFVVIDRGKATEEKILCASRSGNVLTVYDNGVTNGRAADGTSITSHAANAVIEHCMTATDANEANAHVNASTGVHGISGAVVGTTDIQTITNKTITGSSVSQDSVTGLTAALASKAPINVVTNAQTGTTYTLALSDVSEIVEMSNVSANTVTVPPNSSVAFPIGAVISVMQTNTGTTTIVAGSGVTLNTDVSLILSRWSMVTLIKRGTDSWSVQGGGAVPKARVASSTASSTSSVTISGESYTVYNFTGAGSITFDRAGLVDVLVIGGGGGGNCSDNTGGAGGAGGWVEQTSVYVPASQVPVRVGPGNTPNLRLSSPESTSSFQGVTAVGGAPGAQYRDRQPGGGACGGSQGAFVGGSYGLYGQGLIGSDMRGGNPYFYSANGYGGGVADDNGNGANPGANWGNPGSKANGGNKGIAAAANTGNGGDNGAYGNSGIVFIRVKAN